MAEYIEKRWSKEVLEKRLENLKKVIKPGYIEMAIRDAKQKTDNELDALYIAYYELKDKHCKLRRCSFGVPKQVGYVPKKKKLGYYSPYWDDDDDWSWTINGTCATTSSSGIYSNYSTTTTTNAYNYYDSWYTTTILNR